MAALKKILLIEDQEADQFIAKRNLSRRWPEAEILSALDGQQALEILDANKDSLPDVILLDINMPRMNGHEFLQAWAACHNLDIPVVIMLTSSDQESDKASSRQYCFVKDYILKPLNKATIESLSSVMEA